MNSVFAAVSALLVVLAVGVGLGVLLGRGRSSAPKTAKAKVSNRVLVVLGVFILLFIIAMIVTFWVKGSVPDTLIQYTLGAGGVEALVLAAIKIAKVKCGAKEEVE